MLSDSPHELDVRTSVTHIAKPVRHYSGWRYGRRHERILKTTVCVEKIRKIDKQNITKQAG